jgi:Domain of unknown function (DUF3597)
MNDSDSPLKGRDIGMGLFQDLMGKIFHHGAPAVPPPSAGAAPATTTPAKTPAVVDVTAILDKLAADNSQRLDWRHSIVDLMKLVGMDSSLLDQFLLFRAARWTNPAPPVACVNYC